MHGRGSCMTGGVRGRGHVRGRGVCVAGGMRGIHAAPDTTRYGQ